MGTTICRSCGNTTAKIIRWSPSISSGQVIGYTCPRCPRHDEPIRRVVRAGGATRYKVTLDLGADATGRRRQEARAFVTLADARAHVRVRGSEIKTARLAGKTLRGRDAVTVDELCDRWLEARRGSVREITRETYTHALKPVRAYLGKRRVQSLTYADALALRTWLTTSAGKQGKGLGTHAAKTALATFKQVLDHAVRVEGIVSENVARGIKPPKDHSPEEAVLERWTPEQVVAFVVRADTDELAAAWRLATLGLRREEILGLSWDSVDFGASTITVRQTRVRVSPSTDPRRWVLGPPKSAASRRVIRPDSVQPGTMTALKALRLASLSDPKANPDNLVVVDALGAPVAPEWFSDRFGKLAREAGVPLIQLHSTRHSVAYMLHDAGVPPVRAASFLGHTLAVHLSVYLFARGDDVDVAADALGQVLKAVAAEG